MVALVALFEQVVCSQQKLWSQEWRDWNPWLADVIIPYSSRCPHTCVHRTCSACLQIIHVNEGMTKYRVDRIITGAYAGPLAKRQCTALRRTTNYRQVAGNAGVRTVGADVLFKCPVVTIMERTTGWCRYASWRTTRPQQQHGVFENCWRRTKKCRHGKYAVDAVVWSSD